MSILRYGLHALRGFYHPHFNNAINPNQNF